MCLYLREEKPTQKWTKNESATQRPATEFPSLFVSHLFAGAIVSSSSSATTTVSVRFLLTGARVLDTTLHQRELQFFAFPFNSAKSIAVPPSTTATRSPSSRMARDEAGRDGTGRVLVHGYFNLCTLPLSPSLSNCVLIFAGSNYQAHSVLRPLRNKISFPKVAYGSLNPSGVLPSVVVCSFCMRLRW